MCSFSSFFFFFFFFLFTFVSFSSSKKILIQVSDCDNKPNPPTTLTSVLIRNSQTGYQLVANVSSKGTYKWKVPNPNGPEVAYYFETSAIYGYYTGFVSQSVGPNTTEIQLCISEGQILTVELVDCRTKEILKVDSTFSVKQATYSFSTKVSGGKLFWTPPPISSTPLTLRYIIQAPGYITYAMPITVSRNDTSAQVCAYTPQNITIDVRDAFTNQTIVLPNQTQMHWTWTEICYNHCLMECQPTFCTGGGGSMMWFQPTNLIYSSYSDYGYHFAVEKVANFYDTQQNYPISISPFTTQVLLHVFSW